MKKRKILIVVVVALLIGICYYNFCVPDYLIHNSISNSNSYHNTRDTRLEVIVYHHYFGNYDKLMDKIKDEFIEINGESTTLEINLYYSKRHYFSSDKPFKSKEYLLKKVSVMETFTLLKFTNTICKNMTII